MMNRKSTTGFPMTYRWSAFVTLNSPKVWLKNCNLVLSAERQSAQMSKKLKRVG